MNRPKNITTKQLAAILPMEVCAAVGTAAVAPLRRGDRVVDAYRLAATGTVTATGRAHNGTCEVDTATVLWDRTATADGLPVDPWTGTYSMDTLKLIGARGDAAADHLDAAATSPRAA